MKTYEYIAATPTILYNKFLCLKIEVSLILFIQTVQTEHHIELKLELLLVTTTLISSSFTLLLESTDVAYSISAMSVKAISKYSVPQIS